MDVNEGLFKSRLVTNWNRTMLGFISPRPGEYLAMMFGFTHIEGQDRPNLITTPVDVRHMENAEGPEDLLKVRSNTLASIERFKAGIVANESKIIAREALLDRVSRKKVKSFSKTIEELIDETKEYEESLESGYIVSVKNNKVRIPTRCCPYFYLTDDDLNQFKIGDMVSVKFGNGSKVAPRYRNRTVQFVVNNFMKHNWRRPTKRLALIPLEDGWTLQDVLILDDYDRFDCLMTDLFPCNRIPFSGWKSKEVRVKKNGTIGRMPETTIKRPSVKDLLREGPEEILLRKSSEYRNDHRTLVITDVDKRKNMDQPFVFTYKIYTSRDKKDAIKFLEEAIAKLKKDTEELKESIKNSSEFAEGIKYIEGLNYFERRIRE